MGSRTVALAVAAVVGTAATLALGCGSEPAPAQADEAPPAEPAADSKVAEPAPDPGVSNVGKQVPSTPRPPPPKGAKTAARPKFPNVTLTTHEGKKVKFYDDLIKDKIVVINFMYATCTGT